MPRRPSRSWPRSSTTRSERRPSRRSPTRSRRRSNWSTWESTEDAAKASRHAGQGIEQLREGVERAAKSVLGDETAALQRAQGELEDLADQVNREIAQATGNQPSNRNQEALATTAQGKGAMPEDGPTGSNNGTRIRRAKGGGSQINRMSSSKAQVGHSPERASKRDGTSAARASVSRTAARRARRVTSRRRQGAANSQDGQGQAARTQASSRTTSKVEQASSKADRPQAARRTRRSAGPARPARTAYASGRQSGRG